MGFQAWQREALVWGRGGGHQDVVHPQRAEGRALVHPSLTPAHAHSSCAERDEWHSCLSRALPEDSKAQALAAFQHSVEVSGVSGAPVSQTWVSLGPLHTHEASHLLASGPWVLPVPSSG